MKEDRSELTELVYESLSVDKNDQKLLRDDEITKKTNNNWFLYISAIVANLSVFVVSSGFSWTSPALQMLTSNDTSVNPLGRPVTPGEESWIASLYSLGAAIGPLIGGKLADSLGRKTTLTIMAVPKLICLSVICFAGDVKIYYVCRFIMGLVLGTVFAVIPLYLNEISDVHNRGTVLAMMGFFLNGGSLYCLLLGPFVSVKILTFLCAVPLLIFVVLFSLFMVETPSFLITKGNNKGAVEALQKLRNTLDVRREFEFIYKSLEEQKIHNLRLIDLVKDVYLRRVLFVNVGLVFALQFSGINPILAFLETIFRESGSKMSPYISTNLAGGIQVFSTIITIKITEKLQRRKQLLLSIFSVFLCHIINTFYFYFKDPDRDALFWLPLVCLMLFMFTSNLGLSTLPFTIMSETFPHNIKAAGASLTICSCFGFSFIATLIFRILLDEYHLGACFLLLSVSMLIMVVFCYILLPETKGKSVNEIKESVLTK
ncbi:facilitated trehalose transporter Tret1-like [Diorhabda carinulata]|uniref:facilitated trehalose transporter Tret1-like n=1 Tax=Diorhabda carinulata TaxID=1163345 RepID=UPI0025A009E1|nr:facilitated trehalose transporter Tret1-like [Diorhabda carinulata]